MQGKHAYLLTLVWTTLLGCGDGDTAARHGVQTSPLAHAIAQDLATRAGGPVDVWCFQPFGAGGCEAHLRDGTTIPITVHDAGDKWEWRVEPMLIDAAPIEAHVRGMLADLGVAQDVACGARLRRLAAGERVACKLGGGGVAFVTVAPTGKLAVELALDPAAAAARQDHRQDLDRMSRALARGVGDEDDDATQSRDAGPTPTPGSE